jgi:hypothetical protein
MDDYDYINNDDNENSIELNEEDNDILFDQSPVITKHRPKDEKLKSTIFTTKKEQDIEMNRRRKGIDILCDFILVLMHCILYKVNYYNRKTDFKRLIKYNIIVYKCKNEIVCEYISNSIECMRLMLYRKCQLTGEGDQDPMFKDGISIAFAILKENFNVTNSCEDDSFLIKRFTLKIDDTTNATISQSDDEWIYRDTILKFLYSSDTQYPRDFKWQIQLKANPSQMMKMNELDDIFKLFAWRKCVKAETISISSSNSQRCDSSINRLSVMPIKTINDSNLNNIRVQLFIEQSYSPSLNKKN